MADAVDGLMTFPGLAHRMETIGTLGGVRFVNNSKATNIDAARQAMSAWPRFYWIAGGRPKTGGIACLSDLFPRVVKAYLVGEAQDDFARTLDGHAPHMSTGTIEAAVEAAWSDARAAGRACHRAVLAGLRVFRPVRRLRTARRRLPGRRSRPCAAGDRRRSG